MTKQSDYKNYSVWLEGNNPAPIQHRDRLFSAYYRRNYMPLMPQDRRSRVLEIACGKGQFLDFLRSEGYTDVRAIDLDADNVADCKAKGLKAEQADMFKFIPALDEGSLDLVVMNDIIEHIAREDAAELLLIIRDKLANTGMLMVKTCNCNSIYGLSTFYSDFTHLVGYTPQKMKHLSILSGYGSCCSHNVYF
ncbi:methionine biosynthesis protein MetW, partial [Gammaproteobacteria bacterium]|nr:methionine biosynthesis protein MetW [Gammaproteobacteria bacterium]